MTERLALDFDSTLAGTSVVAFDLLCGPDNGYSYSDIEDWTWGFREFGKEAFLSALWHTWTIRPMEVPPMEPDLSKTVERLTDRYDVDVVTAHPDHPGITDGKQQWLDDQNIEVNDLVVVTPQITKANMEYDIYIDDKPGLPAKIQELSPDSDVFLVDHTYNEGVAGDYTRVRSVRQSTNRLTAPELSNNA